VDLKQTRRGQNRAESDRDRWQDLVDTIMNLTVTLKGKAFLYNTSSCNLFSEDPASWA
jgi:hypothetical protein